MGRVKSVTQISAKKRTRSPTSKAEDLEGPRVDLEHSSLIASRVKTCLRYRVVANHMMLRIRGEAPSYLCIFAAHAWREGRQLQGHPLHGYSIAALLSAVQRSSSSLSLRASANKLEHPLVCLCAFHKGELLHHLLHVAVVYSSNILFAPIFLPVHRHPSQRPPHPPPLLG